MAGVSFDRVADRYEAIRGGPDRGRRFATVLDQHLPPASRLLELGVGTGVVGVALAALGHRVVGLDLSAAMLARAVGRVPALVRADAAELPVARRSVDAVVAVWVVHLVTDPERLAAEAARVVRPDGRFVMVAATPQPAPNDVDDLAFRWGRELRTDADATPNVVETFTGAGWRHRATSAFDDEPFERTPNEQAARIERREWSSLWELDDATWAAVVQPVVDELRSLPEPDRPRTCRHAYEVLAFERSG